MDDHSLQQIAGGVFVAEARQRFSGLEVGARMTVLQLQGGLLIHSPIAVDPQSVEDIGEPRWALAPNLLHHLYLGPWIEAGLQAWGVSGLEEKRSDLAFEGVIEPGTNPFGHELQVLSMSCFPFTHEVAVLHRPSRTLLVADLVFNISAHAPWSTRAAMACLGGYPGCRTTLLERFGMHRQTARREIAAILEWEFDRIIMAHGEIIESGGKAALQRAFRWLLKS